MKPIPGHITQEAAHTLNLLLVCHNNFVINYNLNFLNNDVSSSLLQKEMVQAVPAHLFKTTFKTCSCG